MEVPSTIKLSGGREVGSLQANVRNGSAIKQLQLDWTEPGTSVFQVRRRPDQSSTLPSLSSRHNVLKRATQQRILNSKLISAFVVLLGGLKTTKPDQWLTIVFHFIKITFLIKSVSKSQCPNNVLTGIRTVLNVLLPRE